ncbi:MAG: amino acid ABC transporter permease [Lachnospiraceae bacterium]|nr:amino acid ABC transporter permease [Lachnospiraceae bacterium]MDD3796973.1 amino acid ABC transporter permease [Lachnospiraceae bacterium]
MGWIDSFMADFNKTFIVDDRYKVFLTGFKNTITITLISLLVGLAAGILIAILRYGFAQMKKRKTVTFGQKVIFAVCWIVDKILALYVAVMRGVPLVVQLLIMAFVVMAGFPNKLMVCCIAMGLNSAAYVSEVVRGGINAVDAGQMEAGRSLGLGAADTILYIILPQAFKSALPALCNEGIAVLKESSIVGYIAIVDLTRASDLVRSRTMAPMMPLLFIALVYFVCVMLLSWGVSILERRLKQGDRG